ncbi:hypothetical protein DACRYDRAFT_119798 [Dacryopinax primogenitus]|uniref:SH3 domain-containing protein n=1 Tax=Dacryopinax primogenitus (strain DJM 731) TaxID=1858805 RepID=M5FPE2_DACPD|nr:uncharacterized protein DACRYDRAFT_119798 [Dacryopinax primogenitus]EJT97008.1 hypothetical protein DACRYDRAFT_119798 [Dacryopinax primogenitus]
MAQRRPSSAASLAQYIHQQDPPADPSGLDFCNAFWGPNDAGYEVLLARMRGAMRTMEELRAFWKERTVIENEYATKLTKLAKFTLGRDEIGELRNSLDTLKMETEKQAAVHQELAGKMRQELELPVASFITRQISHKKTIQSTVEKSFKNKQAQEGHVSKARERYESDCLRINSAIAQQTLVQGKELEKVRMKLERAQSTIANNEKEYQNFTRALQETTKKWEQQWKDFCDTSQDLEDDRIEFMKDNMWSYANAVSSVCVSDDESCEHTRVSLEQLEVDRDLETFISSYSTGSIIPDPPRFVDFRAGAPGDTQQRRGRQARFVRESKKIGAPLYGTTPGEDYELDERAVSGGSRAATPFESHPALPPSQPPPSAQQPPSMQQGPYPGQPGGRSAPLEPVMLNVGSAAYHVDPNADPQRALSNRRPSVSNSINASSAAPGGSDDPLAQAMNQLRQDSVRRGTTPTQKGTGNSVTSPSSAYSNHASSGIPPGRGPAQPVNYDSISDSVVGGPPPSVTSPGANGPPMAKFMQEPARQGGELPVDNVLRNYQQSFPHEHKGSSRPSSALSRRSTQVVSSPGMNPPQQQQQQQRPVSPAREGFSGIGAQGRSPSPLFQQNPQVQRAISPYAPSVSSGQRMPQTESPAAMSGRALSPQPPMNGHRPVSPAGVYGIELDASGKVARDSVAEEYQRKIREEDERRRREEEERVRRQREEEDRARRAREEEERRRLEDLRQRQLAEQARLAQQQQPQQTGYNQSAARGQYSNYPPPGQPQYQQPPPPPQPTQQQFPAYQQPAQPQGYGPPGSQPQQYGQAPPSQFPPPPRQPSYDNYYQQGQQPPPPPIQQTSQQAPAPPPAREMQPPQGNGNPPPTGQWTSTGEGILFYVKALYDYQATIEEEFDFQLGDIIAVTATPEDGWWSGELLDEARRQKGKHIFPSNFVCLF